MDLHHCFILTCVVFVMVLYMIKHHKTKQTVMITDLTLFLETKIGTDCTKLVLRFMELEDISCWVCDIDTTCVKFLLQKNYLSRTNLILACSASNNWNGLSTLLEPKDYFVVCEALQVACSTRSSDIVGCLLEYTNFSERTLFFASLAIALRISIDKKCTSCVTEITKLSQSILTMEPLMLFLTAETFSLYVPDFNCEECLNNTIQERKIKVQLSLANEFEKTNIHYPRKHLLQFKTNDVCGCRIC